MCTSYKNVSVDSMELRRCLVGGASSILQEISETSDDARSPAYLVPVHDWMFLAPCCLRTSSAPVHTCGRAELPVVQSLLYTSRCVFRPPACIRFRWTHFGRRSHSLTALYRTFIFLGDFWYKSSESCSWRKVCVTVDVWFVCQSPMKTSDSMKRSFLTCQSRGSVGKIILFLRWLCLNSFPKTSSFARFDSSSSFVSSVILWNINDDQTVQSQSDRIMNHSESVKKSEALRTRVTDSRALMLTTNVSGRRSFRRWENGFPPDSSQAARDNSTSWTWRRRLGVAEAFGSSLSSAELRPESGRFVQIVTNVVEKGQRK